MNVMYIMDAVVVGGVSPERRTGDAGQDNAIHRQVRTSPGRTTPITKYFETSEPPAICEGWMLSQMGRRAELPQIAHWNPRSQYGRSPAMFGNIRRRSRSAGRSATAGGARLGSGLPPHAARPKVRVLLGPQTSSHSRHWEPNWDQRLREGGLARAPTARASRAHSGFWGYWSD